MGEMNKLNAIGEVGRKLALAELAERVASKAWQDDLTGDDRIRVAMNERFRERAFLEVEKRGMIEDFIAGK